jgi:hypothetical protein
MAQRHKALVQSLVQNSKKRLNDSNIEQVCVSLTLLQRAHGKFCTLPPLLLRANQIEEALRSL